MFSAEGASLGAITHVPSQAPRNSHRYDLRMTVAYHATVWTHRPHPNDINDLARGCSRL
jgi:hypothetical protein